MERVGLLRQVDLVFRYKGAGGGLLIEAFVPQGGDEIAESLHSDWSILRRKPPEARRAVSTAPAPGGRPVRVRVASEAPLLQAEQAEQVELERRLGAQESQLKDVFPNMEFKDEPEKHETLESGRAINGAGLDDP